jgi:hypothetical protein
MSGSGLSSLSHPQFVRESGILKEYRIIGATVTPRIKKPNRSNRSYRSPAAADIPLVSAECQSLGNRAPGGDYRRFRPGCMTP